MIATGVSGETFIGGGAAMRVSVGSGMKITGQVANEQRVAREGDLKYRVVGGQRFVWVSEGLGSNITGRWVEEGQAPSRNITSLRTDSIKKLQEKGGEGSMIVWEHKELGY